MIRSVKPKPCELGTGKLPKGAEDMVAQMREAYSDMVMDGIETGEGEGEGCARRW